MLCCIWYLGVFDLRFAVLLVAAVEMCCPLFLDGVMERQIPVKEQSTFVGQPLEALFATLRDITTNAMIFAKSPSDTNQLKCQKSKSQSQTILYDCNMNERHAKPSRV